MHEKIFNPCDFDIRVVNLKKYFKDAKAVDGVNLEIKQGEFVALLGPNGAGKTTLVEMIEGLQKPDSGDIYIKGKKWIGNEDELRRIIGISLQETYFFDKVTVLETLNLFASFYNLDEDRVKYILELTNLEEKKNVYVNNLSGGQKQKLALGVALLNNARILLLDEPSTGLDPSARREIWEILIRLKTEKKISLILTTHYMEEAEFLCERIIIMDKGKIIAEGQLEKLLSDHSNSETLKCRKMTLDDLFISMTGRHLHQ